MAEARSSPSQFWREPVTAAAVNWLVAALWLWFASGTPVILFYAVSPGVALAMVLLLLAAPVALPAQGPGTRGYLPASLAGVVVGLLPALALVLLTGASPGEGIGNLFAICSAMGLAGRPAGRRAMGAPAGHDG